MTNTPNMIVTPDWPGTVHATRLRYGTTGPRDIVCQGPAGHLGRLDSTVDTDQPVTCGPCKNITRERSLHDALRTFADEVRSERVTEDLGHMVGSVCYGTGSAQCVLSMTLPDGTDLCVLLSADDFLGRIETRVEGEWIDSHDEHWSRLRDLYGASSVRIDNTHYMIEAPAPARVSGHGGRRFVVLFTSGPREGERVETRNLWCQGTIPPKYRVELDNNAIFVEE